METICFLLFPEQVLKRLCNGEQSSSSVETLLKFSENLIFSKFVTLKISGLAGRGGARL